MANNHFEQKKKTENKTAHIIRVTISANIKQRAV